MEPRSWNVINNTLCGIQPPQRAIPRTSSGPPLSNPTILSTPIMEIGPRAVVQSQTDSNCSQSNHESPPTPALSSYAHDPDHSHPGSETSATPSIHPNTQDQEQYPLGAGSEQGKQMETFNTATIQILCEPVGGGAQTRREAIALLDTSSDDNMVSHNMVANYLRMSDHIQVHDEKSAIPFISLSGEEVTPYGRIKLRFYGNGGMNRRTYLETFQVIRVDGDPQWEIILGRYFLEEKGIYKRLGLVAVHPRKTKAELREAEARQLKHEAEKAKNEMMVREQERKERTSTPGAQTQHNGSFSYPPQHQGGS